jgi:hypothetical protein
MDCERFDKIALDLLYDELDELTSAAARRHLHHCTRCKNINSSLNATKEVGVLTLVAPPADLRERILRAERLVRKDLSLRERMGRTISVLAGYAMRPQLAMAALLLLMVGSSLVFLRARPGDHDQVSVTERGVPGIEAEPSGEGKALALDVESKEAQEDAEAAQAARATAAAPAAPGAASPASEAAANVRTREEARGDGMGQAMAAYQAGRYAEAEQLFGALAAGGGSEAPAAALQEAHAARNGSGCQRAAALYDSVASRYEGSRVADEASWHAASCYRVLGQVARARAHYESLAQRPTYAARAQQAIAALDAPAETEAVAARKASAADAAKGDKAEASAGPAATAGSAPAAGAAQAAAEAAPAAPPPAKAAAPQKPAATAPQR